MMLLVASSSTVKIHVFFKGIPYEKVNDQGAYILFARRETF
jgi:hypothetical protein